MEKSLYDILEESLKGREITIFLNEDEVDYEWFGTVKSILQNDNSRVDIIFDDNKPRMFPPNMYKDCYNIHMNTLLKLIEY